jgi:uncharacterized membrane protein YphA (DoxX/SURF4 family)/peroxiredoxin
VSGVLVAGRACLAVVFAVAGLAKLRDRAGLRRTLRDFGLGARLARQLALVLPAVELAVCGALIPGQSARFGALGALLLLGCFAGAVLFALARGLEPECQCFGALHSRPVDWPTFARNLLLAGVAGFVLVAGWGDAGGGMFGWIGQLSPAGRLAFGLSAGGALLLVLMGTFAFQVLRQNGRLLVRIEALEAGLEQQRPLSDGLPVGAVAPGWNLPTVNGTTLSLDDLLSPGVPVLTIFSDPGCGPCVGLFADIGTWQRAHAGELTIAVLSNGEVATTRVHSDEHGLANVAVQGDHEVAHAYGVHGTPGALAIGPDGRVASRVVLGVAAVTELVSDVVRGGAARVEVVASAGGPN